MSPCGGTPRSQGGHTDLDFFPGHGGVSMLPVSPQLTKNWLLKVENLSLVRACRKQIEEEFGVTLHLTSEDLVEQIQEYAYISCDPALRQLARTVEDGLLSARSEDIAQLDLANIPVVRPIRTPRMRWDKPKSH
jgi:hypothetical protein